jgi:hypothetical protein
VRLTIRPRFTAGRMKMVSAQPGIVDEEHNAAWVRSNRFQGDRLDDSRPDDLEYKGVCDSGSRGGYFLHLIATAARVHGTSPRIR